MDCAPVPDEFLSGAGALLPATCTEERAMLVFGKDGQWPDGLPRDGRKVFAEKLAKCS
jgi:hypothetical protein